MDAIEALGLPESRWADVDGPVHYREWSGPPAGPTFVCVHGLGGSHLNWAAVAPGLARPGRLIAMDLAGVGLTEPGGRGTGVGADWRPLPGFLQVPPFPAGLPVRHSEGGG